MQKNKVLPTVWEEFIFERKDFMKFKVVGKRLILTDCSHEITKGENSFDAVEIIVPRYHDNCDLSELSFRFSEVSEDSESSAVQILSQEKFDEDYIYLCGEITSDFSSITGKVTFMLTGVDSENIVAKFQSVAYSINDDHCLASLPNETVAEQLFNQVQLEAQKVLDAAAETKKMLDEFTIDIASENTLGGVLSGGDISVSESGDVTVQSVKGKTLGKSVPENAVFTDTVYTLPKATTEILGGVKVDGTSVIADQNGVISAVGGKDDNGKIVLPIASEKTLGGVKVDSKTITASEDGTISASEAISKVSDLSVQIAHPNNFLIYDNAGKPSVMVAIPKFYLDEVIDGASHTVHPAFIINGVEREVIYISKYQNVIENGRAYSLPMKNPAVNVNFDAAYNYCKAKGTGWHLMTNAEWAAIALWCKKNGTQPKGNNNYGSDISEIGFPQKAIASARENNGKINKILTGSGQKSWYHDNTFAGIADMNGNIWEWNSGLRLINGEIKIIANNDAADQNNSVSAASTLWKAIMPDGSLVSPGTTGTLKWDYTTDAPKNSTESFQLNTTLEHKQTEEAPFGYKPFGSLTTKSGINVPEILKSLALFPDDSNEYGNDGFWFKNIGEQIPIRSGSFASGAKAGIYSLDLLISRTGSDRSFGFRCAYYG